MLALLAALVLRPAPVTTPLRMPRWTVDWSSRRLYGEDIRISRDVRLRQFMWLDAKGRWQSGYEVRYRR